MNFLNQKIKLDLYTLVSSKKPIGSNNYLLAANGALFSVSSFTRKDFCLNAILR